MDDHHHHDHGDAADIHRVAFESPEMAASLELEGEVLVGLLTEATAVVESLCAQRDVEVRRVLDVGCGPGVGTCGLARRFGSATVVAADGSAPMLEHVAARAERLGLGPRVETRLVVLPEGVAALGRADVVWASMVLHHVGDEVAALRRLRGQLEPGGLLAVVEQEGPLRVLPEGVDRGRPGIWERLDVAWGAWFADLRADQSGATGPPDYPAMFDAAGLELVADDVLTVVLDAPLDARARRFAHQQLLGTRARLGAHADTTDLEALEGLVDERADDSILRRDDAVLRASRHLFVAAAPTSRRISGVAARS